MMRKLFLRRKRGFISVTEMAVLSAIIGILAIVILKSTSKNMQTNFDDNVQPKIERDLWANQ